MNRRADDTLRVNQRPANVLHGITNWILCFTSSTLADSWQTKNWSARAHNALSPCGSNKARLQNRPVPSIESTKSDLQSVLDSFLVMPSLRTRRDRREQLKLVRLLTRRAIIKIIRCNLEALRSMIQ
ncbi:hypothetical protein EVAR_21196_1 [Eumeta japonica]|uniref:Uncharacterized protein n=1 Tax=Eumeta variegata TaxID=151549 RepID=A0A4C1UQ26_EUMVA|nr:hypothetical protein EVAR_21196_1 [Eumeta japonica]